MVIFSKNLSDKLRNYAELLKYIELHPFRCFTVRRACKEYSKQLNDLAEYIEAQTERIDKIMKEVENEDSIFEEHCEFTKPVLVVDNTKGGSSGE